MIHHWSCFTILYFKSFFKTRWKWILLYYCPIRNIIYAARIILSKETIEWLSFKWVIGIHSTLHYFLVLQGLCCVQTLHCIFNLQKNHSKSSMNDWNGYIVFISNSFIPMYFLVKYTYIHTYNKSKLFEI